MGTMCSPLQKNIKPVIVTKSNPTTQDQVIELISWTLNIPAAYIHPYSSLGDDLHLDGIDILLLIAKLESRFNIYLSPEEVESIETIQDMTNRFLHRRAA